MPITANSRPHFSAWLKAEAGVGGVPVLADLWNGMAIIARTYHFQPSEIDELDLLDFFEWLKRC
jgi:hypothetical protein